MDLTEASGADRVAATSAAELAWRENGPDALRLAAALVGPHDAHDVATTAFLRVTAAREWGVVVDQRSYLLRAVRNEASNLHRARARRWRRDIAAVRPVAVDAVTVDVDVYRALARLPLRQRSVVFFAYWHGMTEAEIADLLDLSPGTIHRDLRMARDRLRKELS